MYPDGSKDGCNVGSAVFEKHFISIMRLPDKASIFTAQSKTIDLAMSKLMHFSDSLSVLTIFIN